MLETTPLQNGSLIVNVTLFVTTLVQLVIAFSYVIRGRSSHIAAGIAGIFAFILLSTSYALSAADFVVSTITDSSGVPLVLSTVITNVQTASSIFSDLSDPAVLLVVAFVIRDRYLAYDGKAADGGRPALPLLPFMIISYLLTFLVAILSTASTGVYYAAITASNLSFDAVNHQITISNRINYASVAFYILETILLLPFAIVVKLNAKSDKIINATLFGIIPLLCLRAVAQLTLLIIRALNPIFGSINEDAFTFADITSNGILYLVVLCILCHFFLSIRLWIGPGDPAPHQYHGYPGFQPVAQFPGQWGYPGMQAQQGYIQPNMPYQTYSLPQGVSYYPYQPPGQQYVQQPFQPNHPTFVAPAPGPENAENTPN